MRRRRPLMRAAMVGGGAYVAGKHVANNQAERPARSSELPTSRRSRLRQQAPGGRGPGCAPPPPAAAPAGDDLTSQLMELKSLMDQGVLSPEEFQQAKAKLLGS